MILEIDVQKRRISLGIKQCIENPWKKYKSENEIGSVINGEIRNITEFGLFVGLSEDIDGLIHLSDISEDEDPKKAFEIMGQKLNLLDNYNIPTPMILILVSILQPEPERRLNG